MFQIIRISNGWLIMPSDYVEDTMFVHDIKDIPDQLNFYLSSAKEREEKYSAEDLLNDIGRKQ